MNATPATRVCKRCRQAVSVTPSGHLRAHMCPHGSQCVVPYSRRRVGEKYEHCGVCTPGPDPRLDPGQLPMPFVNGIRKALLRPPSKRAQSSRQRWRLPGGDVGRPCARCGCDQFRRCTIVLEEGGGTCLCVPAGVHGRKFCSACRQPTLPGVSV